MLQGTTEEQATNEDMEPIEESVNQQNSSQLSSASTTTASSPVAPSLSHVISSDIGQPSNSQSSQSSDSTTIILSSPSQAVDSSQDFKQVAEKECQKTDGVFLEK